MGSSASKELMDEAEMLACISLLSNEMDANDEKNQQMKNEIDSLDGKIDAAKMMKPDDRL
jgi:hypothetical protein